MPPVLQSSNSLAGGGGGGGSAQNGRSQLQLAQHLAVAVALTVVLIVINAVYSPHAPSVVTTAIGANGYRSLNAGGNGQDLASHSTMRRSTPAYLEGLQWGVGEGEAKARREEEERKKKEVEEEKKRKEEEEKKKQEPAPTCKDGAHGPKFTSLRVVDDITQEKDVELVMDIHRDPQFREVPMPTMTHRFNQQELCKSYRWKYCTNLGGDDDHRHKLFYTCELRDFIAKVPCAYIDGRQRVFGGLVYDHNRRFPVHAAHPQDTSLDANSRYGQLVRYKELSHNLAVYPFATAHTFERLPRLFLLIKGLPEHVPVLMSETDLTKGFVDMMDKHGIFPKSRVVWWDPDKIYYADTVYFAGEMGMVPTGNIADRNNSQWNTLRVEHCSWAISQPRWLLQESIQKAMWETDRGGKYRVLVVHRSDAGSRMVRNHDQMIDKLKSVLPESEVSISTFIGRDHNVEETVRLFANADILIAPHGAAITFSAVMRAGSAVIEIGYKGRGGMMWPGNYFHTMVVGSGLKYYATLADGDYGGSLNVDVSDVAELASMALEEVKRRG